MTYTKSLADMLKGKKLLIFDFDGTIADTFSAHERAFQKTFEPFNIKIRYNEIAGKKTFDAVHTICKDLNLSKAELENLVLKKQSAFRNIIKTNIAPLPGVDSFLKWAKNNTDFHLTIASSGSKKNVLYCLSQLNYLPFFEHIICGDEVKAGKPNPEIFLKVINLYNFSTSEALIFEDSQSGFEASIAAEIDYFDANQNLWKSLMKYAK